MYQPLHPHWFCSRLDISNIEEIRKELINVSNLEQSGYRTNPTAYNINRQTVIMNCPKLVEYLKSKSIDRKFDRLLITKKMGNEADNMVHVDSYDPKYTIHSLNIGLIDYKFSCTSWYSTDEKELHDSSQFSLDPEKNFAFIEIEKAKEIFRLYYDNHAYLVNTTILHKGNAQKPTRIIGGLRFVPELTEHDLLNMGIKIPYEQLYV